MLFVFITSRLASQDILFHQYQEAPLYTNPSFTGSFEGQVRYNSLLKNFHYGFLSLSSTTNYFSADSKIHFNENHNLGLGISASIENVEAFEARDKHFKLQSAYHYKPLASDKYSHVLSIGASLGVSSIIENMLLTKHFINPGIGVSWKKNSANNFNFNLGVSFQTTSHITTFISSEAEYYKETLTNLHAILEIPLRKNKWALVPDLLISFLPIDQNILTGLKLKRILANGDGNEYIQIGLQSWLEANSFHGSNQPLILQSKLSFNQLTIGLSYRKVNIRSIGRVRDIEITSSFIFN